MPAPKKLTPDESELTAVPSAPEKPAFETVQLRSLADVTMHLGHKTSIEFVGGSALVSAEMAERLRQLGHID